MKIIKQSNIVEWTKFVRCSGSGNSYDGCDSLLEINRSDLTRTVRREMIGTTEYLTFKCPVCGVLTDLHPKESPFKEYSIKYRTDEIL